MPSGTAEPECRERPPGIVPALRDAVNGADGAIPTPAATPASSYDAPHPEATKIIARATIHPTVNGVARAGCRAAPIVVN